MTNGKDHPELKKVIAKLEATLLPCPFCGGAAEIENTHTPHYWAECLDCGCQVSDPESYQHYDLIEAHLCSISNAVTAWNTRVPVPRNIFQSVQ